MHLVGYQHVNLTVSDLTTSSEWYARVLTLEKVREFERMGFRRAFLFHPTGEFYLGLTEHRDGLRGEPFSELRAGMDHVAFGAVGLDELEGWRARFQELGVEHSEVKLSASGGVITFRDPDHIQLEVCAPAQR